MGVGIGQRGFVWGLIHPQVAELTQTTGQTAADFPQAFGLGQLAEQHSYEMVPGTEAFRITLGLVSVDQGGKFVTIKQRNQLTEQAGATHHGLNPPLFCGDF
jgi:hypothetical protein